MKELIEPSNSKSESFNFPQECSEPTANFLAHEVSNSSYVLSAAIQLIGNQMTEENPTILGHLDKMSEAVSILCDTSRSVLAFQKTGVLSSRNFRTVSLLRTIESVELGFSWLKSLTRVRIEHNFTDDLEIYGVSPLIYSMFFNLVKNTLDHSNAESPTITFKVVASEDKTISIEVTDNGIGYRNLTDKERHFGVGLTFCRAVVEAHGGSFEICDQNARLYIMLPSQF